MGEVIQVESVVKEFTHRTGRFGRARMRAIDGVSLTLSGGECVGVVGESGCGKSTLARMMVGLEPPTSGRVLHRSEPVSTSQHWRAVRRSVQYVFQDPYGSLPPRMSIGALLQDVLRLSGVHDPDERRHNAVRALELVGMRASDLDRRPAAFSGGQRQRIGIARALAIKPEILILDEVTSGLDVSIQAQVLNLLMELRQTTQAGYMFISHDLRVVNLLADRVCVMYLGMVVEAGSTASVFTEPQHPYTQGLLKSIPDHVRLIEGTQSSHLAWIDGEPPARTDQLRGCPFASRCERVQAKCTEELPSEAVVGGSVVRCHFPG